MPKCPLCGSPVEAADDYCSTCGGELHVSKMRVASSAEELPYDEWPTPAPDGVSQGEMFDQGFYGHSAPPTTPPGPQPNKSSKWVAIGASIAAVIVAVVAFVVVTSHPDPARPGDPVVSGGSGGSGSSSSVAPSDGANPAAKASMGEYSWDELANIADEISKASSKNEALDIAASYGLVDGDKMISSKAVKSFKLADGTKVTVQLIDVYQDDKVGGKGKAGLTFLFSDCVAERPMNSWASNDGGWAECELRNWLNSDFIDWLPDDLKSHIAKVGKHTNNAGVTGNKNSITATEDKLWLPSVHEICGDSDIIGDKDQATNDRLNSIMNKEGKQYKLFVDKSLDYKSGKNKLLTRAYDGKNTVWWYRTPSPGRGDLFRAVSENGSPALYGIADKAHGVVPGFCM